MEFLIIVAAMFSAPEIDNDLLGDASPPPVAAFTAFESPDPLGGDEPAPKPSADKDAGSSDGDAGDRGGFFRRIIQRRGERRGALLRGLGRLRGLFRCGG